jgi:hypothetical protein
MSGRGVAPVEPWNFLSLLLSSFRSDRQGRPFHCFVVSLFRCFVVSLIPRPYPTITRGLSEQASAVDSRGTRRGPRIPSGFSSGFSSEFSSRFSSVSEP